MVVMYVSWQQDIMVEQMRVPRVPIAVQPRKPTAGSAWLVLENNLRASGNVYGRTTSTQLVTPLWRRTSLTLELMSPWLIIVTINFR